MKVLFLVGGRGWDWGRAAGTWQSALICSFWKEDFAASLDRVLGGLDAVSYSAGVIIDFIIVPSRGCLIPKEVDGVKSLIIEHIEAVALVPALWEDIKADHATSRETQAFASKLPLQGCHKLLPYPLLLVQLGELDSLLWGAAPSDGGDV